MFKDPHDKQSRVFHPQPHISFFDARKPSIDEEMIYSFYFFGRMKEIINLPITYNILV